MLWVDVSAAASASSPNAQRYKALNPKPLGAKAHNLRLRVRADSLLEVREPDRYSRSRASKAVLCEVSGEPIKLTGKRALRKALS